MMHDLIKETARTIVWISTMIHDLCVAIRDKVEELANED